MYTTNLILMNRVKYRRDQIAWQEFYDLYKSLIYRYARQRHLSPCDAEEIVSQCFQHLTQKMANFDYQPTRGKFRSWLKKFVNHRISQLLAKQPRESLLPDHELDRQCDPAYDGLWEKAWQLEVLRYCVRQAQQRVSTQNYRIFRLAVYEGWSTETIARSLDLTPEQVHRAKHKTLQVIRERMADYLAE